MVAIMGLLQRILGRKPDHDAWLAKHPGKDSKPAPPMGVSQAEQDRMRGQMEGDIAEQRSRREQQ